MRHREGGAEMPRLLNIVTRATKVSGGNPRDRQLETTVGVTPKAWATAVVPPKVSMTSFADFTQRDTAPSIRFSFDSGKQNVAVTVCGLRG
jgi:hypothetical protein